MSEYLPLLLEPQFHTRIWGGRRLQDVIGVELPTDEAYGESWSMGSDNPVLNGPLAGKTLAEAVAIDPAGLLGSLVLAGGREDLPLLFKILDCEDWLSIQVHPTDEEARALENQHYGKTESWYIISADPGARLIHGLNERMDPESLRAAVENNTIADHLRYLTMESGEIIHTPAGLIHALGGGLLLGEIQENSDITYRLYDWDRRDASGKPRQLHVEQSLRVTRYEPPDFAKNKPLRVPVEGGVVSYLVACRYFLYQLLVVQGQIDGDSGGRSFHGLYCVSGAAQITWGDGESIDIAPGQTVFIPAALGQYQVVAENAQLLRWQVPDLKVDVIEPLSGSYSHEEIVNLGGGQQGNDLADPALWS